MEELKSAAVMENDQWMYYLRNSNVDIFEMIKSAIMVAASDHPQEFQNKRDMIAQTLFSCELVKCSGCGNCENKEETTTVAQVLKMKEILDQSSSHGCSESVLLETLSKLKHIVKSVEVLKVTGVGKSVNALSRNHASKHVTQVSRTLVKEWKRMVDEWMKGGESETNTANVEKQTVPTNTKNRSMIVRIKMKKGPIIEQKIERVESEKSKNGVKGVGDNEEKLKVTKRKLKEAYEEAEKMKKKRRIRVIEFHELKKKGLIKPLKRKM